MKIDKFTSYYVYADDAEQWKTVMDDVNKFVLVPVDSIAVSDDESPFIMLGDYYMWVGDVPGKILGTKRIQFEDGSSALCKMVELNIIPEIDRGDNHGKETVR